MAASSLVADYLDSSSENEDDDSVKDTTQTTDPSAGKGFQESCSGEKSVDYFRCNDENQSSDEDNENDKTVTSSSATTTSKTVTSKLPNPFSAGSAVTLPSPSFLGVGQSSNSVFITSFQRAEEAKQSILERHVKMTVLAKEDPNSNKKRKSVCRSFQLGKCRYGHKCRYSHDLTAEMSNIFPPVESPILSTTDAQYPSQTNSQLHFNEQFVDEANEGDDEDGFGVQMKRRKRSGVTNSLIPPKKSLIALDRQRKVDRPWTASLKK